MVQTFSVTAYKNKEFLDSQVYAEVTSLLNTWNCVTSRRAVGNKMFPSMTKLILKIKMRIFSVSGPSGTQDGERRRFMILSNVGKF
jgi:hypothetical protein